MIIWLPFLIIFCLFTSFYLFFLFKQKINKWQWLFISYYFFLYLGINSLKAINNFLVLSLTNLVTEAISITVIISLTVIIFLLYQLLFLLQNFKKESCIFDECIVDFWLLVV